MKKTRVTINGEKVWLLEDGNVALKCGYAWLLMKPTVADSWDSWFTGYTIVCEQFALGELLYDYYRMGE